MNSGYEIYLALIRCEEEVLDDKEHGQEILNHSDKAQKTEWDIIVIARNFRKEGTPR